MRPVRQVLVAIALAGNMSPLLAYSEHHVRLAVRDDASVPLWIITPENPVATLILFSGGGGNPGITPDGIERTGNFLLRSRYRFAAQGFQVLIPDKPDDRGDLHGLRATPEHAADVAAIIAFARGRLARPVWLAGTSRGAISAANAARLEDSAGPDGLVLLASVTRNGNAGQDSLDDVELERITVPVLLVHHRDDGCYVSPAGDLPDIANALAQAAVVEQKLFEGGSESGDRPCGARTRHGFQGIEDGVVDFVAGWIRSHSKGPR